MNFDNAPAQLMALVFGWSFTVYLQHRSNRRAESLKRKDKIIDKLEGLADWVESEVSKESFSAVNTETTYSGMISQIEVRISQLNNHVGKEIFDGSRLSALRDVEIHARALANNETPYKIREEVADLVEYIEVCCDAEYFSRQSSGVKFKRWMISLNDHAQSLKGGLLILVSLLLIVAIYQFCHKYMIRPVGTCVYGEQCHLAPGLTAPNDGVQHSFLEMFKPVSGDARVAPSGG